MIGHGLPVYHGYASQYGHGLGNILGGIVRSAIPFVKPVLKSVGRNIVLDGTKKIQRALQKKKGVKRSKRKKVKNNKVPPGKRVRKTKSSKGPRDIFA